MQPTLTDSHITRAPARAAPWRAFAGSLFLMVIVCVIIAVNFAAALERTGSDIWRWLTDQNNGTES